MSEDNFQNADKLGAESTKSKIGLSVENKANEFSSTQMKGARAGSVWKKSVKGIKKRYKSFKKN
jgi:hypothetical protein